MRDLLAVPAPGNVTLTRRKSAGLRQALSANLQKRIRQSIASDVNLAPLFLGLLNPYNKVMCVQCTHLVICNADIINEALVCRMVGASEFGFYRLS